HARLEERRVDELAAPGETPGPQRGEDPDDGEEPGAEVGDRHADLHGRAVVAAGRAHDAAHALRDQVVAAAIRVRARPTEARDRAIDQPGIDRGERLVIDAETPGHAGAIVLDEHVRRRHEALQHGDAVRLFEIEHERALVAVDGEERRRHAGRDLLLAPRVLAARRLDLHDV